MAAEQRDSLMDTFLGDASDEIEIRVTNVSFQEFNVNPLGLTITDVRLDQAFQ